MANRALVSTMGSSPLGSTPPVLVIGYLVINPSDVVVKLVQNFTVSLSYANMNNVTSAIQSAVQANENDASLQVYVI